MVPSTGYLKYFKLYSYEDGFVLQMPVREAPEVIPEFEPQHKLFKVMRETGKWGEELGVATCLLYTSVLLAMVVSYGVSMIVIKFLMQYIKRHNFNSFALYRIALGIIVLIVGFAFGL